MPLTAATAGSRMAASVIGQRNASGSGTASGAGGSGGGKCAGARAQQQLLLRRRATAAQSSRYCGRPQDKRGR